MGLVLYIHTSRKKSFIDREMSSGFQRNGLFVQNIAALGICSAQVYETKHPAAF